MISYQPNHVVLRLARSLCHAAPHLHSTRSPGKQQNRRPTPMQFHTAYNIFSIDSLGSLERQRGRKDRSVSSFVWVSALYAEPDMFQTLMCHRPSRMEVELIKIAALCPWLTQAENQGCDLDNFLVTPHCKPWRWALLSSFFHKWRHWGLATFGKLLRS